MFKLIGTLSCIWLVMAVSSVVAQPPAPVLDTTGQPLQSGVEYFILPNRNQGGSDIGGGLTIIDRNDSCSLYVGQEDLAGSDGYPVIFTPFSEGETVIRENRDFRVVFSVSTICIRTTAWEVAEREAVTERRLIGTGDQSRYGGFFRIQKDGDTYNLGWCPIEACPTCRFFCGTAGILVENGKRLLALDGPVLPVVFKRA